MAKCSLLSLNLAWVQLPATGRLLLLGAVLMPALWLGGCAVEFQNRRAAQEVAQASKPPGSVYSGWRVFQDKCASCHGAAANGSARAPDLLPVLRQMGPRQFVSLVLKRYDWNLATGQTGDDSAARDAQIEEILQRKGGQLTMPAWEGEPQVGTHIIDLYAYLAARAEGMQGTGRPSP